MFAQGQRVSELRRRLRSGHHFRATRQSIRREDVAHLAVGIFDQSNARRTVRIVFDADDFRGDAMLAAFEIHLAILLLVPATDVTRSQPAIVVPAAAAFFDFGQRLVRLRLRDLLESRKLLETQRRGEWTKFCSAIGFRRDRSSRPPSRLRSPSSNAACGRSRRGVRAFFCRRSCRCSRRRPSC